MRLSFKSRKRYQILKDLCRKSETINSIQLEKFSIKPKYEFDSRSIM